MSWSRSSAIVALNWRLLMADPASIVMLTAMPLLLMAFMQGTDRAVLAGAGYASANGAETAVPGMAVLFSFWGVGYIGTGFFNEHQWGTWSRLRASHAGATEIVLGKILPGAALMLVQMAALFAAGVLLFGLRVSGSAAGLGVMMLASIGLLVALSMLYTAILTTANQMNAAVNLGAMVLGGLGGAFAPVDALPGWAQAIAPASPAYWMLQGFRAVILDGGDVGATLGPAAVTLAFALVAAVIAIWRFRLTDEKRGWEG
jgi:ABC-2 type transport system permease protein